MSRFSLLRKSRQGGGMSAVECICIMVCMRGRQATSFCILLCHVSFHSTHTRLLRSCSVTHGRCCLVEFDRTGEQCRTLPVILFSYLAYGFTSLRPLDVPLPSSVDLGISLTTSNPGASAQAIALGFSIFNRSIAPGNFRSRTLVLSSVTVYSINVSSVSYVVGSTICVFHISLSFSYQPALKQRRPST
jgi:hypothetical protein